MAMRLKKPTNVDMPLNKESTHTHTHTYIYILSSTNSFVVSQLFKLGSKPD